MSMGSDSLMRERTWEEPRGRGEGRGGGEAGAAIGEGERGRGEGRGGRERRESGFSRLVPTD